MKNLIFALLAVAIFAAPVMTLNAQPALVLAKHHKHVKHHHHKKKK